MSVQPATPNVIAALLANTAAIMKKNRPLKHCPSSPAVYALKFLELQENKTL
jgi:hypothetical protein